MRFLSWVGNKLKLVSTVDFIDFGSGLFRVRVAAPPLTADRTGTVALVEDLRKRATVATYNVSMSGDDVAGDGVATPFATIQKAIDVVASFDGNGLQATIIINNGTYAGGALPAVLTGWGRLTISAAGTGFITSPINLAGKTPVTLRSLSFTPSAVSNLASVIANGVDLTLRQCTFSGGDAAYVHVSASDSIVRPFVSTTVSGTFAAFVRGNGNTIYHSGSLSASAAATFATFFDIPDGAIVQGTTAPTAPTGTFAGIRYNAAFVGIADALIPGTGGVRTLQPGDADLTAIAAIDAASTGLIRKTGPGAATVVPVGPTGLALLEAGNAAAGRSAIGLGTIATQDSNNVTLDGKVSGYFSANYSSGSKAYISHVIDRLFGANRRASVVCSPNITDPFTLGDPAKALFDSGSSVVSIPPGQTGTITVRWRQPGETGFAFTYGAGAVVFTPYNGFPPASINVTLIVGAPGSSSESLTDCGAITVFPAGQSVRLTIPFAQDKYYVRGMVITIVGGATANYLATAEWFTDLADDGEAEHWLPLASNSPVKVFAPGFSVVDGSQSTTVGPGTIQLNSGATQTAGLRGSKTVGTVSAADTITVVGAAVGDVVSVSRGRDAFVSAANTVQFDSTGLAGVTVSAIVERFV